MKLYQDILFSVSALTKICAKLLYLSINIKWTNYIWVEVDEHVSASFLVYFTHCNITLYIPSNIIRGKLWKYRVNNYNIIKSWETIHNRSLIVKWMKAIGVIWLDANTHIKSHVHITPKIRYFNVYSYMHIFVNIHGHIFT